MIDGIYLLRDFINLDMSSEERFLVDLMIDSGLNMNQVVEIFEGAMVVDGLNPIVMSFDSMGVYASISKKSANSSIGKYNSLDGHFFPHESIDRGEILDLLKAWVSLKDQSLLDKQYFINQLAFISLSLTALQSEYIEEYKTLPSLDPEVCKLLNEIGSKIFGMTHNGKQQYH